MPAPGGQEADLLAFARIAPGVSLERARQTVDELKAAHASAALGAYGATVQGLNDRDADFTRPGLLLLQGVAGFLLLVMCVNLANLFLAHASARHHELGVRAALGAGRARLVRQLLAEAVLIAAAGSLIGVALAFWIVPQLVLAGPGRLGLVPEGTVLSVSWLELTVGLAMGWGAALLFGLAPAWLTSGTDVLAALRTSRQATAAALLLLAGVLACWIPVSRVRRVSPVDVLRAD